MGIQDRDYYRRATSGSLWWQAVPPVTRGIIVVNVVVFLLQQVSRDQAFTLLDWFAASVDGTFHHMRLWQLLTATFLHGGLYHILGNMYFLWIVGREMESIHGSRDFLAFYLSAAVLSTLAWLLIQDYNGNPAPMIGASGAVFAVVTLYTLYYPTREMLFMFWIPMPMWMVLAICLIFPYVPGFSSGRIAVEAHLAGAVYGWLYKQFDLRLSRLLAAGRFRPRLRVVSPDRESPRPRPSATAWTTSSPAAETAAKPSVAVATEEQLNARVDDILAKIAREGRGSLTEEEQRILQEASRRAQLRRSDRL